MFAITLSIECPILTQFVMYRLVQRYVVSAVARISS